mmetsp:Transcript_72545/g.202496  ORF Transcript_72545/g.202496 Transcript_72545/m.202496 type:complete len:211 (+) Transcript_72545:242-874(+)
MRLRMMGSSLFSGSFVQPRMPMAMPLSSVSEVPTRWTSLPSMATTPRVAISDSLLRLPGQLPLGSCTGLDTLFFSDTKWSGLVSPFCSTYSNASSAVAPSQPPEPPQLRSFFVQDTIACEDSVGCCEVLPMPSRTSRRCATIVAFASIWPSSVAVAASAQHEPQPPWFRTISVSFLVSCLTVNSAGYDHLRSRAKAAPGASALAELRRPL